MIVSWRRSANLKKEAVHGTCNNETLRNSDAYVIERGMGKSADRADWLHSQVAEHLLCWLLVLGSLGNLLISGEVTDIVDWLVPTKE